MARHSSVPALNLVITLVLFLLWHSAPSHAQTPARNRAERAVPSPSSVLGFTPGDDRTIADWKQITDYFTRLDRASDRVLVQNIGSTTLGRPFLVAFISAPENIRNLAKYQAISRKLADPRMVRNEAEREALIREGKTIVAISCSIHSTEIVASQMSLQLAHDLAAAGDAETREMLQNTILLLIPSANPDGIDIVADWYRKTLNTPFEGTNPPELYHHYAGHDNNRDWFMLNLKESQIVTRLFWQEWFPQIVYDVHQMGAATARFFIPPFFDPPNPHVAPLLLRQVGLLGHKIAADLQAAGFQGVITNAMYDTWWHGGFRTAPYFHNSIGILSEAASARLMTPAEVTRDQLARSRSRGMASGLESATNFPDPWPGGHWRPRDIMNLELSASRSVLSMAAKYRAEYLRNFYELGRKQILSAAGKEQPVAYLIPAGESNDEAVAKLVSTLAAQGVEVHRLDHELHAVLAEQKIILQKREAPGAAPATDENQGAQPPASNADARHPVLATIKNVNFEEIPAGSYLVLLAQPTRSNVLALFEPQVYPDRRGARGEAERPYDVSGWTLPMQMGVKTRAVMEIREPVAERRLTLITEEAQVRRDLGLRPRTGPASPIANPVRNGARVGLYRSWMGSMDEGWTRFVFDTFNVPFQTLRDTEVRSGNLRARFDVIVLPSERAREIVEGNRAGSYPAEYTSGITEAGVENLRRFVEEGGTLVCFDASSELALKRFKLPVRNVLEGLRSSEFYGPGSILKLELDTAHPLARGLQPEVDAYFINSSAFEVTDSKRARVVARYADREQLLRSGWLLGAEHLAGRAALVEVSLGRGSVILFAFRPQHRGQTWGTFPLIFNALSGAKDRAAN